MDEKVMWETNAENLIRWRNNGRLEVCTKARYGCKLENTSMKEVMYGHPFKKNYETPIVCLQNSSKWR